MYSFLSKKFHQTDSNDAPNLVSSFTGSDPLVDFDDNINDCSQYHHQSRVTLHEFEEKNLVMEASISAITWFQGNIQTAARNVRCRLKEIIKLNPWLLGRLVRNTEDRSRPLQLVYDEGLYDPAEYEIDELFIFHSIHDVERSYTFSIDMSLQETTRLANEYDFTVKPAKSLIDQDEPIFKIAIVPDSSRPNQFALITSLSHRVGDGFTFYSLYKMLDPKRPVILLNPERKLDVVRQIEESMGKKMLEGIGGFWVKVLFAKDIIMSKLRGDQWSQKIFLLDDNHIKRVKQNLEASKESGRTPSTNDIVVSSCFDVSKPDLGLMCINFRGKINNCNESDAPNYFNTIIYRPRDYATPALIRESISGECFERAAKPPTELLKSTPTLMMKKVHVSICTNWATFNNDDFSLGPSFQQVLHMPLKDMRYASPSLISNFTVFKPWPGKIAICVAGSPKMVECFSRASFVLRNPEVSNVDVASHFV